MTTSAIEHAVQQGRFPTPQLTYGYYRQPNGWITVSPVTAMDELKYRREGWEPLTQYGRVAMETAYAASHPLEALFMAGGARELPRDQIIEMGLHLNSPLVPVCRQTLNQNHPRHGQPCWQGAEAVTFPQLGDDVPEGLQCRFCDRAPFPTDAARSQHEGVLHREEKGEIRSGETLAASMIEGLKGLNAKAETPKSSDPYLCGGCGLGFTSPVKLAGHFKQEHKENADGD